MCVHSGNFYIMRMKIHAGNFFFFSFGLKYYPILSVTREAKSPVKIIL